MDNTKKKEALCDFRKLQLQEKSREPRVEPISYFNKSESKLDRLTKFFRKFKYRLVSFEKAFVQNSIKIRQLISQVGIFVLR